VYDYRYYKIPRQATFVIFIAGLFAVFWDREHLIGHLLGAVCISGLMLVAYVITKGKSIGAGDIRLMFSAGLYLGLSLTVTAFLIGSILALIVQFLLSAKNKENKSFAYGPYLSIGIAVSILFLEANAILL